MLDFPRTLPQRLRPGRAASSFTYLYLRGRILGLVNFSKFNLSKIVFSKIGSSGQILDVSSLALCVSNKFYWGAVIH